MLFEDLVAPRIVFDLSDAFHPGPFEAEVDAADSRKKAHEPHTDPSCRRSTSARYRLCSSTVAQKPQTRTSAVLSPHIMARGPATGLAHR